MTIRQRLANWLAPALEQRDADPSWAALSGGAHDWTAAKSGALPNQHPAVTPRVAENFSTVMACVGAISQAIGSLPVWVYRRGEEEGRIVDPSHALARMFRDGANEHQSWPAFIEWLLASALLHGNGLAEVVVGRNGEAGELRPIPWPNVTVRQLKNGRLVYDVSEYSTLGGDGRMRRLLDSEVLHLRDRSDDGLIGRSRLARAAPTVRSALTMASFEEYLYENRATPAGVLTAEQPIGAQAHERIAKNIQEAWAGVRNAGKILFLDGGLKWQSLTITPENLEMLAARRFSTEEIARLYQVPPPIVGIWDHSTFTNSETAGRWFAQFTLAPWIRKLEEEFRKSVFSSETRETHEIEFDMTGFLRGDAEARWKAHEIAVRNEILTPDEVREVEGWNPKAISKNAGADSGGGV